MSAYDERIDRGLVRILEAIDVINDALEDVSAEDAGIYLRDAADLLHELRKVIRNAHMDRLRQAKALPASGKGEGSMKRKAEHFIWHYSSSGLVLCHVKDCPYPAVYALVRQFAVEQEAEIPLAATPVCEKHYVDWKDRWLHVTF